MDNGFGMEEEGLEPSPTSPPSSPHPIGSPSPAPHHTLSRTFSLAAANPTPTTYATTPQKEVSSRGEGMSWADLIGGSGSSLLSYWLSSRKEPMSDVKEKHNIIKRIYDMI
jgi:hypothetical protein